jgi:alpha-beta hydrolase superfamily lysophospholipase
VTEVDEEEGWLTSGDGQELFWRGWVPPGATVALAIIHGLGDHSGRHRALAHDLAHSGIATFAVDLRGAGRSPGQRGHIESWDQYVADATALCDKLSREFAGEMVPLGHSFGGAVLLSAILSGRIRPARFALSAPALRLKMKAPAWKTKIAPFGSRFVPRLALNNEVPPSGLSRNPAIVEAYRTDPLVHDRISSRTFMEWSLACEEILANAGQIGIPFLAIHGECDPIIDPAATETLYERAVHPARQLHVYPERLHEPFNDLGREEVIADLARWLTT